MAVDSKEIVLQKYSKDLHKDCAKTITTKVNSEIISTIQVENSESDKQNFALALKQGAKLKDAVLIIESANNEFEKTTYNIKVLEFKGCYFSFQTNNKEHNSKMLSELVKSEVKD